MTRPEQKGSWLTRGCAIFGVVLMVCLLIMVLMTFFGLVPPAEPALLPPGF
ncbi:MAG: hypothetical protein ACE5H9_06795 [Anaerolineae bacterium]